MNKIINIIKPTGMTSHDVVSSVRKILNIKKVGHTGTLDPDASGVLPICIGKATKVSELILNKDKSYICELTLGITTDTYDSSGEILERVNDFSFTKDEIEKAFDTQRGHINQLPPMYSALKVNGKKLYELAREGKTIERKARPVTFYEIRILSMNLPRVELEVTCSKGTYIRTLCNDIGEKLGCGGCMESLVRSRVGRFDLSSALTLSEIEALRNEESAAAETATFSFVHPIEEMFSELPEVRVAENCDKALYNGNAFHYHRPLEDGQEVRMYTSLGEFIGIYRYEKRSSLFHIVKMFYER